MATKKQLYDRRKSRTRRALRLKGGLHPRLTVFRSNKYIYAQIIDDARGMTLVAASSLEKNLRTDGASNKNAAVEVGKLLAERAKTAGVTDVKFDRGGYRYHGRVKALAEAAREGGLSF